MKPHAIGHTHRPLPTHHVTIADDGDSADDGGWGGDGGDEYARTKAKVQSSVLSY